MPRSARIDSPGLLQHVIVRGIERRDIFANDGDREDFRERFQALLQETGTECLAWALLSNHVHLLVRPQRTTLAKFMRRLLTGYAVTFNLRHQRSGHLFQNRYKSIVCDEESYLLELVRYIHLNPVRAGLVAGLEELARFPWSGHAALVGNVAMPGQAVAEVLLLFGTGVAESRRRYRTFIEDGLELGQRNELSGTRPVARTSAAAGPLPPVDPRILGDEAFVEQLRMREDLRRRIPAREPLADIVRRVAENYELSARALCSSCRQARVLEARARVCVLGMEAGYSGADIGRHLGMTRSGVGTAAKRGKLLDHGRAEPLKNNRL